jgi:hypothetical protein
MVNIRGGLYYGGFAPFVQRLIAWCDLHCANALSRAPRFPPLEVASITSRIASPKGLSGAALDEISPLVAPANTITKVLHSLRSLSTLLKHVTPDHPADIWYSDQVYSLQRQLFDLSYSSIDSPSAPQLLEKATATAALIFSYAALRDIPFNFRVIGTMVANLQTTLAVLLSGAKNHTRTANCLQNGNKEVFWALALGTMASEGRGEHEWFCRQLRVMCLKMRVRSWGEIRDRLEEVVWVGALDAHVSRLWNMIEIEMVLRV